ncbi:MAG: ferritin [Anaeromyxobacteraceae bacterium]|jgi:ferritin|nr:ferritin [Anaeromyxobacteraceae bacterium]
MISKTMQDALNAQINLEQASAQLYLAMSAHCERNSFRGFAHWLKIQAGEETAHALKLVDFLLDRQGKLELKPVAAPATDFGGVVDIYEKALAHERAVSGRINALFEQARLEKDYASELTLQWFVTEQVEEESQLSQIVDHLHAVGDKGGGIWFLDSRMAKRGAK